MIFRQLTSDEKTILGIFIFIAIVVLVIIIALYRYYKGDVILDEDLKNILVLSLILSIILLYVVSDYWFRWRSDGPIWLFISFPFIAFIAIVLGDCILIVFILLIGRFLNIVIDFFDKCFNELYFRIHKKKNRQEEEFEEKKWAEFSLNIFLKFKNIKDLVSKNNLDLIFSQLMNLKEELENYPTRSYKKNKFISEEIEPLIKQIKLQKEIKKKITRLCNEFKSQNNNLEIARSILKYFFKIREYLYARKISIEFYNKIKSIEEKINHILKKNLIRTIIALIINPSINLNFIYSDSINYFDVLKKWRILEKNRINLKEINSTQFQHYIEISPIGIITNNIKLLNRAYLKEEYLQDISLLGKSKKETKDHIKKSIQR